MRGLPDQVRIRWIEAKGLTLIGAFTGTEAVTALPPDRHFEVCAKRSMLRASEELPWLWSQVARPFQVLT